MSHQQVHPSRFQNLPQSGHPPPQAGEANKSSLHSTYVGALQQVSMMVSAAHKRMVLSLQKAELHVVMDSDSVPRFVLTGTILDEPFTALIVVAAPIIGSTSGSTTMSKDEHGEISSGRM